ncbi:MAG: hypothetical protein NVSMB9_25430 [Isosphaeraceae bacterium]
MTEDRTEAPSSRRRQQAREGGQVAHSPELTSAIGLLAASAALSIWGEGLAAALLALMRAPLLDAAPVSADAGEVVARMREMASTLARPLLLVLGTFVAAAIAAHQAQVRGLWAPGLLAPDPTRLWRPAQGGGLGSRAARGFWALARTAVVVAVASWVIRADWASFQRLGGLDMPDLARASGRALWHLSLVLAVAALALGLLDFALQWFRFEGLLRLTPEEHREDLRSMEGDPALRARRRQAARSWRADPAADRLVGVSLVLTGPSGLTVLLAGGPPPRRITVRSALSGAEGVHLHRAAILAGVPEASAPLLASLLSRRRPPGLPLDAKELAQLAPLWPATSSGQPRASKARTPASNQVATPDQEPANPSLPGTSIP